MSLSFARHLLSLMLLFSMEASAHDPFLATVEGETKDASLIIRITLRSSVAAYLAGITDGPRLRFLPEQFEPNQNKFKDLASGMSLLQSGATILSPSTTVVRLTEQSDVEVTLTYPKPAAGLLHFESKWLHRLPANEEYQATLSLPGNNFQIMAPSRIMTRDMPGLDFKLEK